MKEDKIYLLNILEAIEKVETYTVSGKAEHSDYYILVICGLKFKLP